MADREENTSSLKAEDAQFMAECLKHLQTPANIDVKGVAAALNYKNAMSVANRIRVLKKKFDLKVNATNATGAVEPASPAAATKPPRKGAAANRGPAKAKPTTDETPEAEAKSGSGAGAKKTRAPRKRAVKGAAKGAVREKTLDEELLGESASDANELNDD